MNDQDMPEQEKDAADEKVNRWVWWCMTRSIFAPRVKSNMLARLMPPQRPSRGEPDAFLDAEMPYFNMAVHALCDQAEHAGEAECFLGLYWYGANIKALAGEQQCARGTVYTRARRFAQRASSLGVSMKRVHDAHVPDKVFKIIEQNSCA